MDSHNFAPLTDKYYQRASYPTITIYVTLIINTCCEQYPPHFLMKLLIYDSSARQPNMHGHILSISIPIPRIFVKSDQTPILNAIFEKHSDLIEFILDSSVNLHKVNSTTKPDLSNHQKRPRPTIYSNSSKLSLILGGITRGKMWSASCECERPKQLNRCHLQLLTSIFPYANSLALLVS